MTIVEPLWLSRAMPSLAIAALIIGVVTIGLSLHRIIRDSRSNKPQSWIAAVLLCFGGIAALLGAGRLVLHLLIQLTR